MKNNKSTPPVSYLTYAIELWLILLLMGALIQFVFGSTTFGQAFSIDPVGTVVKIVLILVILGVLTIAGTIIARMFGSTSGNTTHMSTSGNTTNISYGQGGAAGPGGQGGQGGQVVHIQGFPVEVGSYKIEVGKGGAPGEPGEPTSITTPSGQVITAEGGNSPT